jgi:hypothetical protein
MARAATFRLALAVIGLTLLSIQLLFHFEVGPFSQRIFSGYHETDSQNSYFQPCGVRTGKGYPPLIWMTFAPQYPARVAPSVERGVYYRLIGQLYEGSFLHGHMSFSPYRLVAERPVLGPLDLPLPYRGMIVVMLLVTAGNVGLSLPLAFYDQRQRTVLPQFRRPAVGRRLLIIAGLAELFWAVSLFNMGCG